MTKASKIPHQALCWIGLFGLLAIAAGAYLFLSTIAFGVLDKQATQIDEYYFAACAARGLDSGAIPIAACHDNKPPLIYLIYESLFAGAGIYNFVAVRIAAFGAVLLDTAVLAWAAARLAGGAAAIVTASLFLLCVTSDIGYLSLKTELIGSIFLSLSILVLSSTRSFASPMRLGLAGLLIGTAVVAKQPYAFAGFAVIAWLFVSEPIRSAGQFAAWAARSLFFGLCVLTPFLLFWVLFSFQGAATDYLESFFIYPMVYGDGAGFSLAGILRRIAGVPAGLADQQLLTLACAGATAAIVLSAQSPNELSGRYSDPRWLLLLLLLFLLAALVSSPIWFSYHVLIVAGPMALLSGVAFGDYWKRALRNSPRAMPVVLSAILIGALVSAAATWRGNGRLAAAQSNFLHTPLPEPSGSARYAYQLGEFPDFYARGKFIPASSVQFSWALPGTPNYWAYAKPNADTQLGRILKTAQTRNLARLFEDFRRTPPRYIVLQRSRVAAPDSPGAIGIPGMQAYLEGRCTRLPETPDHEVTTYDCRGTVVGKDANTPF